MTKEQLLKETFKEYIENSIFFFSQVEEKGEREELYNLIKKDYYIAKEIELKRKIAVEETQGNIKESEKLLQEFLKLTDEIKNER